MRVYYKMNTTVPEEAPIPEGNVASADEDIPVDDWADWEPKQETQSSEPVAEETEPEQPKGTNIARMVEETADKPAPTGSLANSVASAKTVTGVDASKVEKPAGLKRL